MTWLISLLAALLPAGIKAWLGIKQDAAVTSGVNQEKANESTAALKNASDANAIAGDVDRMSDAELRDSPYANRIDN